MVEPLDKKLLSRDCPGKTGLKYDISLGIFGRRCLYLNYRCSVPETHPVSECPIYHDRMKRLKEFASNPDQYQQPKNGRRQY